MSMCVRNACGAVDLYSKQKSPNRHEFSTIIIICGGFRTSINFRKFKSKSENKITVADMVHGAHIQCHACFLGKKGFFLLLLLFLFQKAS